MPVVLRQRLGGRKTFWVLFCVFFAAQGLMAYILRDLDTQLVSLQLTWDATDFRELVGRWTPVQLEQYAGHFAPDFFYPVIYGVFFTSWVARTLDKFQASARWNRTLLLPWLGVLADYAENCFHLALLSQHQQPEQAFVTAAAASASLKWFVLLGLLFALVVLSIRKRPASPDGQ